MTSKSELQQIIEAKYIAETCTSSHTWCKEWIL